MSATSSRPTPANDALSAKPHFINATQVYALSFPYDRKIQRSRGKLDKRANRLCSARSQYIVISDRLLQHSPHPLHVVSRKSPIPLSIDISQFQHLLLVMSDTSETKGHFPSDELFGAQRAFMIE